MKNDTIRAFELMFNTAIHLQEKNIDLKKVLSSKVWLKEYCTIRFGMPRQAGNTRAIKHMIKKLNPFTFGPYEEDSVVFVKTIMMGEMHYGHRNFRTFSDKDSFVEMYQLRYVFVDNSCMISKNAIDKLYNKLAEHSNSLKIIALVN